MTFNIFPGKSTKSLIIGILSKNWPLSLKEIHSSIKRLEPKKLTYQAVFKAVNELVEEKVIIKNGKEYLINKEWINEIKTFGNFLEKSYQENDKENKPKLEIGHGHSLLKDGFLAGKEAANKEERHRGDW